MIASELATVVQCSSPEFDIICSAVIVDISEEKNLAQHWHPALKLASHVVMSAIAERVQTLTNTHSRYTNAGRLQF